MTIEPLPSPTIPAPFCLCFFLFSLTFKNISLPLFLLFLIEFFLLNEPKQRKQNCAQFIYNISLLRKWKIHFFKKSHSGALYEWRLSSRSLFERRVDLILWTKMVVKIHFPLINAQLINFWKSVLVCLNKIFCALSNGTNHLLIKCNEHWVPWIFRPWKITSLILI